MALLLQPTTQAAKQLNFLQATRWPPRYAALCGCCGGSMLHGWR
jgi:hypothetical protein